MSVSVSMKNFVIKISDVRGGGGEGGFGRHSDNPGQTGEGGSENHDFGRTSFVNAPLPKFMKTTECVYCMYHTPINTLESLDPTKITF